MHHRRFAALAALLGTALCGAASAAEIKGADILNHPCGKIAVKSMGLLNQGKIEEANKLATKSMQDRWKAMPAKDRLVMAGMAKMVSPPEDKFAEMIKAGGVLEVDDKAGKLTVVEKKQDANGSSTSTTNTSFAINGAECLIHR